MAGEFLEGGTAASSHVSNHCNRFLSHVSRRELSRLDIGNRSTTISSYQRRLDRDNNCGTMTDREAVTIDTLRIDTKVRPSQASIISTSGKHQLCGKQSVVCTIFRRVWPGKFAPSDWFHFVLFCTQRIFLASLFVALVVDARSIVCAKSNVDEHWLKEN